MQKIKSSFQMEYFLIIKILEISLYHYRKNRNKIYFICNFKFLMSTYVFDSRYFINFLFDAVYKFDFLVGTGLHFAVETINCLEWLLCNGHLLNENLPIFHILLIDKIWLYDLYINNSTSQNWIKIFTIANL